MCDDNEKHESFEDMMRSFAREVSRSAERITQFDVDSIAEAVGVDPERAKEWADSAGKWLRGQVEGLGDDFTFGPGSGHPGSGQAAGRAEDPRAEQAPRAERPLADDPLARVAPHPLDLPTGEQGIALAALDSGRWTVEPGSNALTGHGDGPPPNDALGLVRELQVRDWIGAGGEVTLVGRHALSRWLEASATR